MASRSLNWEHAQFVCVCVCYWLAAAAAARKSMATQSLRTIYDHNFHTFPKTFTRILLPIKSGSKCHRDVLDYDTHNLLNWNFDHKLLFIMSKKDAWRTHTEQLARRRPKCCSHLLAQKRKIYLYGGCFETRTQSHLLSSTKMFRHF